MNEAGRTARIRVLVADDHALVRRGLVHLINEEPGMEVVGDVGDGMRAVEEALSLRPDVVLMDIGMPRLSGVEATRQITQSDPHIRVLMLTVFDQDSFLFHALQAGASGYLLKGAEFDELIEAVRTVHAGNIFVYASMASKLVDDYLGRVRSGEVSDYEALTPREREILPLLADDRAEQEIATLLSLSPNTVRTYRQRVMEKLNLHSKTALLKYALRRGLVSLDE
jgi:two-component system, NarL family, response regulator NreC